MTEVLLTVSAVLVLGLWVATIGTEAVTAICVFPWVFFVVTGLVVKVVEVRQHKEWLRRRIR